MGLPILVRELKLYFWILGKLTMIYHKGYKFCYEENNRLLAFDLKD